MDRSVFNEREKWGFYEEVSTRTPGYREILASGGKLPNNYYFWYRQDGVSPLANTYNGLMTQRDAWGLNTFRNAITTGTFGSSSTCPSLGSSRIEVANKLVKKLRDNQIDLGVALGEVRETAAFLSGAMFKAAWAYRQLRRGDVSAAVKTLTGKHNDAWRDIPGVAANTWLAYSYGLRPLVKDVHDAATLLQKGYQAPPEVITIRSTLDYTIKGGETFYAYYTDVVEGHHKTTGVINFVVSNPLFRTLDQCGVVNPLSIAWELVPFSFVVDWFVPVGTFIQNIMPPQGVEFVDGYYSIKAKGSRIMSTAIPFSGGWYTDLTCRETLKIREPMTSFPSYSVIVPDISLSKEKIASGLALLWSTLIKSKTTPGKGNFSLFT